jgi:hypothetical protein
MKITTVGLDLAKSVFHVVCFDEHSKEVKKRVLRRNQGHRKDSCENGQQAINRCYCSTISCFVSSSLTS